MKTSFLQKEYLTLALIKAKNDFFHENFVTTAELNQFIRFIQQHFINQKLDIVVTRVLQLSLLSIRIKAF